MWDDFCITNVDQATYAEIPINEMVFWSDDDGEISKVELPAFRVTLTRKKEDVSPKKTGEGANLGFTIQV